VPDPWINVPPEKLLLKDACIVYRREKVKEKMIMFTRAVVKMILLALVIKHVYLIKAFGFQVKAES
jgi:hypothetical protein